MGIWKANFLGSWVVVGDCFFLGPVSFRGFPTGKKSVEKSRNSCGIPHMSSQVSGTSCCDGSVRHHNHVFIFDWRCLHIDHNMYVYIYIYTVYLIHIPIFVCSYVHTLTSYDTFIYSHLHSFLHLFIDSYIHSEQKPIPKSLNLRWSPWNPKHLVEA